MRTAHQAHLGVYGGSGMSGAAEEKTGSGFITRDSLPRVTPPLPFEAEEFDSQIPEENWRHRLGVPQVLDFPALRV